MLLFYEYFDFLNKLKTLPPKPFFPLDLNEKKVYNIIWRFVYLPISFTEVKNEREQRKEGRHFG
jgi:hypothetical protein